MILAALFLAFAPLADASADTAADFDAAVEAYRRGDFASAETLWFECLADDELAAFDRAAVQRNLGNAAWRQGRGLEAVARYTASLRDDPRNRETWASLEHARAESGLEPADRGDLSSTLQLVVDSWTPAEAQWMVVGACFLWLLCLIGEALRGGLLWRLLAWGGFLVVAAASAPLAWHLRETGEVWMVTARDVELRSEPRGGLPPTGVLEPCEEVTFVDEVPDWVRVETDAGARGWVPRETVLPLVPDGGS